MTCIARANTYDMRQRRECPHRLEIWVMSQLRSAGFSPPALGEHDLARLQGAEIEQISGLRRHEKSAEVRVSLGGKVGYLASAVGGEVFQQTFDLTGGRLRKRLQEGGVIEPFRERLVHLV